MANRETFPALITDLISTQRYIHEPIWNGLSPCMALILQPELLKRAAHKGGGFPNVRVKTERLRRKLSRTRPQPHIKPPNYTDVAFIASPSAPTDVILN